MKQITVILVGSILFFAEKPVFSQSPDTTGTTQFVIGAGETLYSLALSLQLSTDSLMKLNPDFPDVLPESLSVRVPSDRASVPIQVKPGETLFAISRRFGVSVEVIQAANRMSNTSLRSGQTLIIPGQGVSPVQGETGVGLKKVASGVAVVYPESFVGRMTANGRMYRQDRFVISHPDLSLGSIVLISSPITGRETFAEITDRGFLGEPQIIDISASVATQLRLGGVEDQRVEIHAIEIARH